jgi:hypothetical protein
MANFAAQHRLVHGRITPPNVLLRNPDHLFKLADTFPTGLAPLSPQG